LTSAEAKAMTDCLFCKIIDKQTEAKVVYEDERALAFRDINPQAPLHVLVIPKTHVATINDIRSEHEADLGHLFRVAAEVAKQEGLETRGYRTVMNCGAEAGQSVFHVHLHVVGGRSLGWPPFPKA
jgi:histidine triad (HIT) family protein